MPPRTVPARSYRSQTARPRHIPPVRSQGVRKHRPDYILLLLMVALTVIGVIVVFSISPALGVEKGADGGHYIFRQFVAIGLGMLSFFIAANVPLERWKLLYKPMLVGAGILTILALIMPVNEQYPAHRWVRIAGFSFQSVELLKLAGIMWLSGFLVWRREQGMLSDVKKTLYPLFGVLIGAAFVVAGLQSDFGSFIVIVAVMFVMAFISGLPMKRILLGGLILAMLGSVLIIAEPYRRDRLTAFLHPDCTSRSGYQACQALIAIGSGGMAGLGLGNSVQAYGYLPEAENDSIFAVYAEKFGFLGSVLLVGLFAALFTRIKKVAEQAPDFFTRLMITGILVWLLTQTTINIGAMLGLMPLKGITLPLVSYGGSSVLMIMAALGVVFQASRYTVVGQDTADEIKGGASNGYRDDRRGVRGTYYPSASRRP